MVVSADSNKTSSRRDFLSILENPRKYQKNDWLDVLKQKTMSDEATCHFSLSNIIDEFLAP